MSRVIFQTLSNPLPDTVAGMGQLYLKTDNRLWMKVSSDAELPVSSINDSTLQNNTVNLAMRQAVSSGIEKLELETGVVHNFNQTSLSGLDLTVSGTDYNFTSTGASTGYLEANSGTDLQVVSETLTTPSTSYLCTLMIFACTTSVTTPALNTEIKGSLSRDGGVSFIDLTMEQKGTWGTGAYPIYVARDVSMSVSNSLKYKLHIDQGTDYQIHGTYMGFRDNG